MVLLHGFVVLRASSLGTVDPQRGGRPVTGIGLQNGIEGFEIYLETKLAGVAG